MLKPRRNRCDSKRCRLQKTYRQTPAFFDYHTGWNAILNQREDELTTADGTPAMIQQTRPKTRARTLLLFALVGAALAAVYALAGFLLVPWLAERELPRFAEEQLHHRARIGEVRLNPFTLRLQLREFALETRDGKPVLGFADAVADIEWHSLLRRAWVLDEVRLVDPALHVEIAKDGRLNLAALLPETGGAVAAQPARFAIGRLSVVNGSIDFADQRQGYRNRAERLSIELSSLSTLDAEKGPYVLTGQTPGGATLQWKGEASLTPLAATGTLAVGNAALAELMPYVNDFTTARVAAGRADLELPYQLTLSGGKPQFSLKGAKLRLHDLSVAGSGEKALLARFGAIALGGIDFDWGAQQVKVKTVHVGDSSVSGAKDKVLLARVGAVALDAAEFAMGTGHGSAHGLSVAGVTLAAGGEAKPAALLRQVALAGIAVDLGQRRVSAKSLRVAEFTLAAKRDANGELDLLRLFAGRGGAAKAADAKTGAKPSAWQASVGSVELGNGSVRYTDDTAKTPLALALDGLSGGFAVEAASTGEGVRVRLDAGNLTLARLDARAAAAPPEGAAQPAVRLTALTLDGGRYDSAANAVEAGAVRVGGFGVDAVLESGRLSLLDLVPAAGKAKSEKPLSARARRIVISEGGINVADRGRGLALALERVALSLKDPSTDGTKPLEFRLSADVKSGGRIALRGSAVPAQGTLEAKLDASSIALAPAQTVLAQFANVKFASGDVSLSGTLRAGTKEAKLGYSGSASVANLALEDTTGVRLIGWKSLATDSLKATLTPDHIDIDELRLTAPAGRFAIAKDGTSNISRAFAKNPAAAGEGKPAASEARAAEPGGAPAVAANEAKPGAAGTFAVLVRRVRVDQGALDFSDDSLSQGFVAKIYDLAGTANGLSSNHDARSQFSLEGRVDEFGYARLSGAVNPFAPRNRSTFRVQLRNVDLISATPYAIRFAGYRIATGRLGLDLNYRVRDNLIEGDNKITLEQFTLGDRVDSPDALKLPFELAVKLLKDDDGTISLEVPVKGNLDDPQFSLAPLIWKAVGHFIGNIVAAPFRALAHLFGGSAGDDLGTIAFDPGRAKLLPPEKEKLVRVVAALAKHPEMKLLIPARYDTEADARAMKRAALNRDIGRKAGFSAAEDEEPGPVNIEDRSTRRALRQAFAERFSKDELDRLRTEAEAKSQASGQAKPSMTTRLRNLVGGEPQLVDTREFHQTLLRRLRETQVLAPNALAELAQQRAIAVESAMKAAGADASRVARSVAEPSSNAEAKQVTIRLTLAGH
jgi:hypothetical protein